MGYRNSPQQWYLMLVYAITHQANAIDLVYQGFAYYSVKLYEVCKINLKSKKKRFIVLCACQNAT